jgi:energy-converting hydrogenase A subunit R
VSRVFISDCEGPISKNDNAYEATAHFVPKGAKMFTVISRYDDALASILRRRGYKAGDTLKLVLPFLKAYGVTDQKMREFSAKNLVLVPGAKETVNHVRQAAPSFIVSTSYEHYIEALCQALEFPFANAYCTRVSFDKFTITERERKQLKQVGMTIAQIPTFEVPASAESPKDLSESARTAIQLLDEIFWEEIGKMEIGRTYFEVKPIGGTEKAEAIIDVTHKLGMTLNDVVYVGDSITDEEAFKLVKRGGGLTVSFNGNQYAVRDADIAVLSESSVVTAVLADIFINFGKQEVMLLVENWDRETVQKSGVTRDLLARFFSLYRDKLPEVKMVTNDNMEALAKQSSEFRKKVRGEVVGGLG